LSFLPLASTRPESQRLYNPLIYHQNRMETILFFIVTVILLAGGVLLFRDYYVARKFRSLTSKKYKIVDPLMQKLASNEALSETEVVALVKDPSLRHIVFRLLDAYNMPAVFPSEYMTIENAAESFLVTWLEFPTELGKSPDKVEFFNKVTLHDGEALDYYVFRFRAFSPKWADEAGWMLGVCGPYTHGSNPYDVPLRVFSRFSSQGAVPAESEVQWVHDNISR
jgi:hypothetical protein